jgi:hypothetical protein
MGDHRLALFGNTTGSNNTAIGFAAGSNVPTGGRANIAIGFSAGALVRTGDNNIHSGNLGIATDSALIRIGTAGTQPRPASRTKSGP